MNPPNATIFAGAAQAREPRHIAVRYFPESLGLPDYTDFEDHLGHFELCQIGGPDGLACASQSVYQAWEKLPAPEGGKDQ